MRFISKCDIKLDFLNNILCPYLGCYKLIKIINKYPKHNILKRPYRPNRRKYGWTLCLDSI